MRTPPKPRLTAPQRELLKFLAREALRRLREERARAKAAPLRVGSAS